MSPTTSTTPATLIDCMIRSLSASARHQPGAEEQPAAILWTDAKGEWKPLLPLLRERLPQLLVYGEYDAPSRTGPAIWLKCAIARTLDDVNLPADKTPIIYLPEVSRQSLRAGDECPWELQPLVELLYRGVVWTQKSGRDWTVEAMLVSDDALGLDVARDNATRLSMMASLSVLADTPVTRLVGRKLEAEDFDKLMVGDHPRDLLRWMSDPEQGHEELDGGKWHAFCSRCRDEYGFDPEAEGETAAGERLGTRPDAAWIGLWRRFCEAPAAYPGIPDLLKRSKPSGVLTFDKDAWPDENEAAETRLRDALSKLEGVEASEARTRIAELEAEHAERRGWVWSKLGFSPLAQSLEHLARLAQRTATNVGGDSPNEMAQIYAESGYLVDDAALQALATVKTTADSNSIQSAVRAVYLPWIEKAAERLQELTASQPLPHAGQQPVVAVDAGVCILFADGLRYDLAQRLAATLSALGLRTNQDRRWSALPSVTATAKPAVAPVESQLKGVGLPETFTPEIEATAQGLSTPRFRKLLESSGYQVISAGETGNPGASDPRGWCEFGQIDRRGHDMQLGLAGHVEDEISLLAERIVELLDAGWRAIRVVTDHGWLLMPGSLPKHKLPHYLVESKWSRCASIKGQSKVSVPKAGWHWNPAAEFAVAPGVSCFSAGKAYAHGGVSLQECLLADLTVEPSLEESKLTATIKQIEWRGLRLRVGVEPADTRLSIDLRSKPNSADSSIALSAKQLDDAGNASLVVEDDDLVGTIAAVVVLDIDGRVLTKQTTTVGGDE